MGFVTVACLPAMMAEPSDMVKDSLTRRSGDSSPTVSRETVGLWVRKPSDQPATCYRYAVGWTSKRYYILEVSGRTSELWAISVWASNRSTSLSMNLIQTQIIE